MQQGWPGNVRELENRVIQACTLRLEDNRLSIGDFRLGTPGREPGNTKEGSNQPPSTGQPSLAGMSLSDIEKLAIRQTLEHCGNNRSKAARMLGIASKSIYNKINKYGL